MRTKRTYEIRQVRSTRKGLCETVVICRPLGDVVWTKIGADDDYAAEAAYLGARATIDKRVDAANDRNESAGTA